MKPLVRRSLTGATVVLALLALLAAFAAFVLPGIVRTQAEKAATEALHRRLTIEAVHINPLTLEHMWPREMLTSPPTLLSAKPSSIPSWPFAPDSQPASLF